MTERRPNLVSDVGMHTGEDTAAFLAAGFDVVAVEANPDLVKDASQRFAAEVADGRLRIINAAIAEQRGTAQFGICSNSVWSSMDPDMIARNERAGLASYEYIEIDTIPFGDVMHQHGVPYYLKVDVEGYDMLCVRALRRFESKPMCISVETHVSVNRAQADAVFDELAEFWTLGYRKFRYVSQDGQPGDVPRHGVWPGPAWRSPTAALAVAQVLRAHHNFCGFGGRWSHTIPARTYIAARNKLHRGAPWYDLQTTLI